MENIVLNKCGATETSGNATENMLAFSQVCLDDKAAIEPLKDEFADQRDEVILAGYYLEGDEIFVLTN